jgi:hypothetical protein
MLGIKVENITNDDIDNHDILIKKVEAQLVKL